MNMPKMQKVKEVAKKVGGKIKDVATDKKTYFYLLGAVAANKMAGQEIDNVGTGNMITPAPIVRADTTIKSATTLKLGQLEYADVNGTQRYNTIDIGENLTLYGTEVSMRTRSRVAANENATDLIGSPYPAGKMRTTAEVKLGRKIVDNAEGSVKLELGANTANNPEAAYTLKKNWSTSVFGSIEGGSDGLMGKLNGAYETFGGKSGYSTSVEVSYNNDGSILGMKYDYKVGGKGVFNEIGMNNTYGFVLGEGTDLRGIVDIKAKLGESTNLNISIEGNKIYQNASLTLEKAKWNLGAQFVNYDNLVAGNPIQYQQIVATFAWKY